MEQDAFRDSEWLADRKGESGDSFLSVILSGPFCFDLQKSSLFDSLEVSSEITAFYSRDKRSDFIQNMTFARTHTLARLPEDHV